MTTAPPSALLSIDRPAILRDPHAARSMARVARSGARRAARVDRRVARDRVAWPASMATWDDLLGVAARRDRQTARRSGPNQVNARKAELSAAAELL